MFLEFDPRFGFFHDEGNQRRSPISNEIVPKFAERTVSTFAARIGRT